MKKIILLMIAVMGFTFAANAQQDRKSIQGDYDNTVLVSVSYDGQTSTSITFYNNSTKTITVSVSVYNDQNSEVGKGTFTVPGASAQGSHSESTATISKIRPCSNATSGCEAKRIQITSAKVKN
jgi:hypothetical protein